VRGLEAEQIGTVTVVKFTRSEFLDDETIEAIGAELFSLVDNLGCRQVVLNLAKVKRVASLMLGKLLTVHKKLKAAGGRLVLCGVDPEIYKIFETLRFPQLIRVVKDEQEALQAF
jgi:anti-sigma B factor antagonist